MQVTIPTWACPAACDWFRSQGVSVASSTRGPTKTCFALAVRLSAAQQDALRAAVLAALVQFETP